jgi:hypothetical protein
MNKIRIKEMVELRNEGNTLQEIGNKFGITRERVRQLLVKYNGTSEMKNLVSRYALSKIIGCTEGTIRRHEKSGIIKPKHIGLFYLYKRSDAKKIASIIKRPILPAVMRICRECGAVFYRRPYEIRPQSPGNYCSRQCLGKVVGAKYGFRVNAKSCGAKRRYDYGKVLEAQNKGWSPPKISKEMGIPINSVYYILRTKKTS